MPATLNPRYLGAAAIVLGLATNKWTLGLLTSDGEVTLVSRIAVILFFQLLCVGGGIALLRGWLPLPWDNLTGSIRSGFVVALLAGFLAFSYWGIETYNNAHNHTELVSADLARATADNRRWTEDFYKRSLDAALRNGWFDFDYALTQGFQYDRVNRTHYPNLEYMFDNIILDPERPEWLVYHDGPDGKVLMALMFFTRKLEDKGPTPGGPLALWHYHPYENPKCAVEGIWTIGKPNADGACEEGWLVEQSPEMFHVWFMDHPLGRFTEMKIVPEVGREESVSWMHIHPVLVHFTIALFVISVCLDLAGMMTSRQSLHDAAFYNLVSAAFVTMATVAAGMTAEVFARTTVEAHETLDLHKLLAFSFAGLLAVLTIWRAGLRGSFPRRGAFLYSIAGIVGVGLVSGAGYYGGEMVYRHGTGVDIVHEFTRETYFRRVQDEYLPLTYELNPHIAGGGAKVGISGPSEPE